MAMVLHTVRVGVLLSAASLLAPAFAGPAPASGAARRPNVVMIVVDDMRFDEFGAGGHPYLETPHIDRLAAEGATFTRAYHATPLCSPNRASLLTGQYASRHGILDNTSRSSASHQLDLFARDLQAAGYRTAHVGKWHMGNDPTPRPGYDYWVTFPGQGRTLDPELYEDGRLHRVPGYITDVLTERAVQFITRGGDAPFFLYVGHKAVHPEAKQLDDGTIDPRVARSFIPAARHRGRYDGRTFRRRPNDGFSAADRAGKPVLAQALAHRAKVEDDEAWRTDIATGTADETFQRRAEMMLAIDESVGRILAALEDTGALDDTVVIFTSDNGYFYGEHGLTVERRLPYEESVRTPLLVRAPKLAQAGTRVDGLAVSVDLAATVLDVAGLAIPPRVQGRSLRPLLSGAAREVHDAILIEYHAHENPFPWTGRLDYRAVLKGRHKYIRWLRHDEIELYDLAADPYELRNLGREGSAAPVVAELEADLRRLVLRSLGL